jgi:hypothetical protein
VFLLLRSPSAGHEVAYVHSGLATHQVEPDMLTGRWPVDAGTRQWNRGTHHVDLDMNCPDDEKCPDC